MPVSPHSESTPPPPPQPMGQYYLLEKIARGGMAEIYKGLAYDLHGIKRTVVIKKILPQAAANREFIDMLVAEAKIAVMLTHGNIAQIYDLGKSGEDFFIVMEYVDGRSISQLQRECAARCIPIPIPIACYLCAEIASGLDYMHQRTDERGQPLHIVHRDVSPQNVLISYSGTVKIIDFGIAKARTKLEDTEIGVLKGKFAYMSPEHARGDPIDHRSDVFSLGVILHELLTSKRLFKAKENRDTLKNVRNAQVSAPSHARAEIPAALDAVVLCALAKTCEDRYQRAASLRDDLFKVLIQHYPEFRDHQLADFLHTVFVDEQGASDEAPEGKTPFLIIDHTQSAIAPRGAKMEVGGHEDVVPAMMAEYMLPEERAVTISPEMVMAPEHGDEEVVVEPSITHLQRTLAQRLRPWWGWPRGPLALVGILLASGLIAWWHGIWSPMTWWQRVVPMMASRAVPQHTVATPHAATVALHSTPAGATIFLNDVDTGLTTPALLGSLEPTRRYTIGLHLPGYRYWSVEKTFSAAAQEELSVPLEIDYGRLVVMTKPAGATVTMNGRALGETPLQHEALPPGAIVEITLSLAGYETVTHTQRVRPGHTIDIRQALERVRTKKP